MARQRNPDSAWGEFRDIAEQPLITTALVVATIWFGAAIIPSESGWHFGIPFRILYSGIAVVGGGVFVLFKTRPMRPISSTSGVVVSITMVYLVTVGLLVLVALVFPQFETETGQADEVTSVVEQGRTLFNNPNAGCFLCHTIEGRGGKRGPDLTRAGEQAATRRPGLSAEEYIRESIVDPRAFLAEDFPPIMPPDFATRLTEEEINDLVAYLRSLK